MRIIPSCKKRLEAYTTSVPEALKRPKNPYTLFQNLKTLQEPWVICQPPEVEGMKINIDKFREVGNAAPLTFADLPKIDRNLISDMLGRLKNRSRVGPYLKGNFEISFEKLESLLLGEHSLVAKLLRIEPHDRPISNDLYYLYTIIFAISNTPAKNSNRPEDPLTEQEGRLVAFALCLMNCSTGQSDAFAMYFNTLPLRVGEGREKGQERLVSLIDNSIQSQLSKIVSDEQLVLQLMRKERDDQISHQVAYLKNRLRKQMGLKQEVTFDANSGNIDDTLLNATAQELLPPVIQRCTPPYLIDGVKEDMDTLLCSDQTLIQPILKYIQTKFIDISERNIFQIRELSEKDYISLFEDVRLRYPDTKDDLSDLTEKTLEQLEEIFEEIQDKFAAIPKDEAVRKFKEEHFVLTKEGVQKLLLTRGYLVNVIKD